MRIRPKRPRDANQLAKNILDIATGEAEDPKPTERQLASRKGGLVGGAGRAKALTEAQRLEIAKKAARARWKKS